MRSVAHNLSTAREDGPPACRAMRREAGGWPHQATVSQSFRNEKDTYLSYSSHMKGRPCRIMGALNQEVCLTCST